MIVVIGGEKEYPGPSEIHQSSHIVRLINLTRVVMYFSVAFVQFVHLECLQPEAIAPCDTMLVYVPLFLGLLDSLMVIWSTRITKRFWQVAFLVSILAILVSANSLMPLFPMSDPITSLQSAMLLLGGAVFVVSTVELIFFRGVHLQKTFSFETETSSPNSEIRTY